VEQEGEEFPQEQEAGNDRTISTAKLAVPFTASTAMTDENQQPTSQGTSASPTLNVDGKRYDLNSLPDDIKQLVVGVQVAANQIKMQEDNIKILALGRQSLVKQLGERLRTIDPLPEAPQSTEAG